MNNPSLYSSSCRIRLTCVSFSISSHWRGQMYAVLNKICRFWIIDSPRLSKDSKPSSTKSLKNAFWPPAHGWLFFYKLFSLRIYETSRLIFIFVLKMFVTFIGRNSSSESFWQFSVINPKLGLCPLPRDRNRKFFFRFRFGNIFL